MCRLGWPSEPLTSTNFQRWSKCSIAIISENSLLFYQNVRKGRLFDFIEGGNGYDKFVFPAPFGEIVTNAIGDIDGPLQKVFEARIRELDAAHLPAAAQLRRA